MPYRITETITVIQDVPSSTEFHIQSGDYFLYLATIAGMLEDTETLSEEERREHARRLRRELRYVHSNYKVVPREPEDIQPVQPPGNLILK